MSAAPTASPAPGECHLWIAPARIRPGWLRWLSDDERDRMARSRSEEHRRTIATSRPLQRLVAARYLGVDPERVTVTRDCAHCADPRHGRPRVDGLPDISVTHAGDLVLLAVIGHGSVGVDLEGADRVGDPDALAPLVLTGAEREELRALPPGAGRRAALLRAWVRKEAVLKLTGHGLAMPMASVDVRGAEAVWLDAAPSRGRVLLADLPAPRGMLAALATTEEVTTIRRILVEDDLPESGGLVLDDDLVRDGLPGDDGQASGPGVASHGVDELPHQL